MKASNTSFEEKTQEFLLATKLFEDEIGKEQRRYNDFSNDIVQSLASIQTGSEKLNEEWKVAYQEVVAEGCSVTDLFDMLQELVNHINSKYSSDQDNVTDEHLKEVSTLKGEIADLRNALNTKATEIKNLNACVGKNKSESEEKLLEKSNLNKALSSDKVSLNSQFQSMTEESKIAHSLLVSKTQSFQELEIKFNSVQVSN